MDIYKGPWPFDVTDRSVPANVRLLNIGAIGSSRDGHEFRFGALPPHLLPASDGSQLPTPAFESIYGGAAYWGHYVIRRAARNNAIITIEQIMEAYSTGHSDSYARTICDDTGIGYNQEINLWTDPDGYRKLYHIMLAMGRWEAGARKPHSPGYPAFQAVYDTSKQWVVDELFYGMLHGMQEAWRDNGLMITAKDPPKRQEEPEQSEQPQQAAQDPLIHGFSGYRTVITGALGIFTTFLSSVFDLLGLENAEKLGQVSAQILIGLAAVFLLLKFWKRFESILQKGKLL